MKRHAILHSTRLGGVALLLAVAVLASDAPRASAGGGGCHTSTLSTGAGVTAEIRGNCYTPTVLHVQPGHKITWTNHDAVPHTVTGLFDSWGSTEQFSVGQSVAFQFEAAGTFPYYCAVHPMMQGVVVAGDGLASGTQPIAASMSAPERSPEPQATTVAFAAEKPWDAVGWPLAGLVAGVLATGTAVALGRRRQTG
jgi:plastocyanin